MSNEPKVRYSDEELKEFKALIEERIAKAKQELDFTEQQISELNENGFNQQGGDWNDDASIHSEMEFLQSMASRQRTLVQNLANALLRIENKTYGICSVTGQLIDKNRLRLVPHATKSVDGKNIANSNRPVASDSGIDSASAIDENDRNTGRPIGDKVRIANSKRNAPANEDWEVNNEALEDAGYDNRKFDEDEE